jgi:V/A-type H+-transporting ATPase subunit B
MTHTEYVGISEVDGPFVLVEGVRDISYGELVDILDPAGKLRRGRAILVSEKATLVQVFSGTQDLIPATTRVRFLGHSLQFRVSPAILGRVFNGLGEPRDGCGPLLGGRPVNVNGRPINPMARRYPRDFIQTGLSSIDTLTTLIRGQKLPIFSGNGLPHNRLAVQIATQSRLVGSDNYAAFFERHLIESGTIGNIVMFLNLADDPVIERIATPRFALAAAEYLAFEQNMHVLIIITDMTNYCEALRELGVARGEVPSRKGYPAYMYSDLAALYERAGVLADGRGSLTQLPILSMPNDDITHPIPDLTGFITEGQIVLSRALDSRGIYPPTDVLMSLSRLMKDGIGEGYTREDHPELASQIFAACSRVQEVKALAGVVGEDELGKTDRAYLAFGEAFEKRFIHQEFGENREIELSLDLCWELLGLLPESELTRLSKSRIDSHLGKKKANTPGR